MPRETRRARPLPWARRPWGVVRIAVLVSAIPSLLPYAVFLGGAEDALFLLFALAGVPGMLAVLRLIVIRADGSISVHRLAAARPTDDHRPRHRFSGDCVGAAVVWLVGAELISVAALASGEDDGTVVFAPLLIGLLWILGLGLGAVIGVLLVSPVGILIGAVKARRRGRPFSRGRIVAALVLPLLLVWGVASFLAAAGVSDATGTPARSRRLIWEILFVDVSEFDAGVQVAAWIARAAALGVAALGAFGAFDARKHGRLGNKAPRRAGDDSSEARDSAAAE